MISLKNIYIDYAKHCIGLRDYNNRGRLYTRHGRRFYKPYRNYFATPSKGITVEMWEELCKDGFAKRDDEPSYHGGYIYRLTRKGLDWLGSELDVKIYDEE